MGTIGKLAKPRKEEMAHSVDLEGLRLPPCDIICFANDWGSDPLSKKQIVLQLAMRHRVLWINSINNRRPRFATKDFSRTVQKLRDFSRPLIQVNENIWVCSLLYIPYHGQALVRSFNRWFVGRQIRKALRQLKFAQPITWAFLPTSADVVGTFGEQLILYQCVDEYKAFTDSAPEICDREVDLLRKADLVVVSSAALLESKQKSNPHTYLVTHGVDYEHFRRASDEDTQVAAELGSIKRPILGFHGLIADWVDLHLIAGVARRRQDWSIVLVGRVDVDLAPVEDLPNVHLLGHHPYSRLPEFLRGFDVALLPFVCNELTRNANPLKLREYLAAGLPVVAAPLPEVLRLNQFVSVASTPEEYVREVSKLLDRGCAGPSRQRSEGMAGETWASKVTEIEQLLLAYRADKASYHEECVPLTVVG